MESTFVSATASSVAAPPVPSPASKTKAKGSRKWLWILIACLLLGGAGGGGWWWWQARNAAPADGQKAADTRLPAQYHALEPAFVVNLADQDAVRYLQADLQLVTRDPLTLAAFQAHAPAIRNRLLLLFGQQSALQLGQRSGKERLQQAARDEVHALLKAEGAPDKVEAVIFTSLVTQ
jgi:flagellar FliL protein